MDMKKILTNEADTEIKILQSKVKTVSEKIEAKRTINLESLDMKELNDLIEKLSKASYLLGEVNKEL